MTLTSPSVLIAEIVLPSILILSISARPLVTVTTPTILVLSKLVCLSTERSCAMVALS